MITGLVTTQMHDLATSHMRDRQRDARERADRVAARRGRVRAVPPHRSR